MTHTVLHLNASARQQGSISRLLSGQIVDHLAPAHIISRDLASGLPFLDEIWTAATFTPPQDRTQTQTDALALSDDLVAEVQSADAIVIGTAMYNFNIPATLKAWLDQIARAGVTFRYGENGPEGLLKGKKVIIAISSGGTGLDSDYDFASPYLRHMFGFMGITDVTVLDAQGTETLTQAA